MNGLMPEYLRVPAEKLGEGVPVKLRTCGDMAAIAGDMARVMLELIEAARSEGRGVTLIVPVGPVDQFPVLACHQSQLRRSGDGDFTLLEEQMMRQARARGAQAGVAAAEAFRAHLAWKRARAW